jgi:hypothetical protein
MRNVFIDFEEGNQSIRCAVLYMIVIEFSIPMNVVKSTKLHLN